MKTKKQLQEELESMEDKYWSAVNRGDEKVEKAKAEYKANLKRMDDYINELVKEIRWLRQMIMLITIPTDKLKKEILEKMDYPMWGSHGIWMHNEELK